MLDQPEKIEANIRQLEALKASGAMPSDLADISIAALKKELATHYNVRLTGNGAIAQGDNTLALAPRAMYVGGNFEGNIYWGEDPASNENRLKIYCEWVRRTSSNLPLRGIDVGASDPTEEQKLIGLPKVYVDLDTTIRTTNAQLENLQKGQSDLNKLNLLDETDLINLKLDSNKDGVEEVYVPALLALVALRQIVLLGEPGGGKSTFINFLAHCFAANILEPNKKWLDSLSVWPQTDIKTIPILVTLRDFAQHFGEKLPMHGEPEHLLEFIAARLKAQNLAFALPVLENALDSGMAIVLLDGLDEVRTQNQRIFVRDIVRSFISRYKKNHFLITCRILSYLPPEKSKPDLRLSELPTFTLASFNQQKIDRFIAAWYTELGHIGSIPISDVPVLTARLSEAVRRPDLQRLSTNPLLLTVMALVHTHRGRLPNARALLYEETIDILLWRWEQIKLGRQENVVHLRQHLLDAGRTDVDLKVTLWRLAYEAHITPRSDKKQETLADIPEHHIIKALSMLKCDDKNPDGDLNWAKQLVDIIKIRAGLLLERQPDVFTFPHRTFQEYLAGAYLAAQADFPNLATELARTNMSLWREVILYAVGKLVYVNGETAKSLALVAELCPDEAENDDASWRLAWLASDILLEIGLRRVGDSAFGRDLLKRCQIRLKNLLEKGKLSPIERVNAGNTDIGDLRFNPEYWYLPVHKTLGFIHIPAGEFIMGSDPKKDKYSHNEEQPQHKVKLPQYWLAKYPVTVAQFRAFVEDTNYAFDRWQQSSHLNHPVTNVNWYDVLEYCKWLNMKLSLISRQHSASRPENDDLFWQMLAAGSLQVTIPSEAEWEKAARSTDGLLYPWGENSDPNRANYDQTGIGSTSPVGIFPSGASFYGLLDMSGNVWEWTRSLWGQDFFKLDSKYPYQSSLEYENIDAPKDTFRIVRGGSFAVNEVNIRCAFRLRVDPVNGVRNVGFRVMLSNLRSK